MAKESINFQQGILINEKLRKLSQKASRIIDSIPIGQKISAKEFIQKLEGDAFNDTSSTFFDFTTNLIEQFQKSKQLSVNTIKKYKSVKEHIKKFQESSYNHADDPLLLDQINMDFHVAFLDYSYNELLHSSNTAQKHIKIIKKVMKIAFKEGVTSNDIYRNEDFTVKGFKTIRQYLEAEEVAKLEALTREDIEKENQSRHEGHKLDVDGLMIALEWSLVLIHTGQRVSDAHLINVDNIQKDRYGKPTLYIQTKKMNEPAAIPVKGIVQRILDKYDGYMPPMGSEQKMNKKIKILCQIAKIDQDITIISSVGGKRQVTTEAKYKKISLHCFRKTFGRMAEDAGIPIAVISKMYGHSKIEVTESYLDTAARKKVEVVSNHAFFR